MNLFYAITTVILGVAWFARSISRSHAQLTNNNDKTKEHMSEDEDTNNGEDLAIVSITLKYHETSVEVAYHPDDVKKIEDIQAALENLESHEEENRLLKSKLKKGLGFIANKINEYKDKI